MRLHILLPLTLLAAPLAAQQRVIAPAPSPLFARAAVVADPSIPHEKIPVWEARVIGGLTGLLVGVGLAEIVENYRPCGCDDPGLGRAVSYGLVGMAAGIIVGPMLMSE